MKPKKQNELNISYRSHKLMNSNLFWFIFAFVAIYQLYLEQMEENNSVKIITSGEFCRVNDNKYPVSSRCLMILER